MVGTSFEGTGSNKSLDKICELDITEFNSEDCKYTTLKRSSLINFLKTDLEGLIRTGYNISKIEQKDEKIKLSFENAEVNSCKIYYPEDVCVGINYDSISEIRHLEEISSHQKIF